MKTSLLLTAFALLLAASAQAQLVDPNYGGAVQQAKVPPATPANPGTYDQRTPTNASPTQLGASQTVATPVPPTDQVTLDKRPVQAPIVTNPRTGAVPTTTTPAIRRRTTTNLPGSPKRRAATQTSTPLPATPPAPRP